MSDICATCLSRGRTLESLDFSSYGWLVGDKVSLKHCAVCWECSAIIQKLVKFRSHILYALACDDVIPPSLSGLTVSHFKTYDICCEPNTLCTSICVKQEIVKEFEILIKQEKIDGDDYERITKVDDERITTPPPYLTIADVASIKQESTVSIPNENNEVKKDETKKLQSKKTKIKNEVEKNYICVQMNATEMEERREQQRLSKRYQEVYMYRCDSCIVGFHTEEKYNQHVDSRHSEKIGPHQCEVCKARFSTRSSHLKHSNEHFRKYKCQKCGHSANKLSEIKLHDANMHGNMKFKCNVCDLPFSTQSGMRFHREKVHADPIECDICGKKYGTAHTLLVHKRTVHKSVTLSTCHICRASCRNIARHMASRHVAPRAPAYCAECDKRFTSVYIYRDHLKFAVAHRSKDSLKFACSQCESKFVNAFTLKKHILDIHKKRVHKCDRCDRAYKSKSRLANHVLYDHEGVKKPRNNVCHLCGRGFTTKAVLRNHLRTHTGEKPFECHACPASFSQKSTLATHIRGVHTKAKDKPRRAPSTNS